MKRFLGCSVVVWLLTVVPLGPIGDWVERVDWAVLLAIGIVCGLLLGFGLLINHSGHRPVTPPSR